MPRKPQGFKASRLEDGFNVTARDFDRALGMAKLTPTQVHLMQQAREESWAKSKPKKVDGVWKGTPRPFTFNVKAIAATLGADRSVIYRNVKDLVAMNVLKQKGGSLLIQKDYHDWFKEDGKTRLFGDDALEYIRLAVHLNGGVAAPEVEDSDKPVLVTKKSQMALPSDQKVTEDGQDSDQKVISSDFIVTTPIEDRARSDSGERIKTDNPPAPRGGNAGGGSGLSPVEQMERGLLRLVLAVPNHDRDEILAETVIAQARMKVDEGYAPSSVLNSYTLASDDAPRRPKSWGQWVETNLGRRKVKAEADAAKAHTNGVRPKEPPVKYHVASPERRAMLESSKPELD